MDRRFTVAGAIKDADGRLRLADYLELKAQVEDPVLCEGREGMAESEQIPAGLHRWKDEKGSGWVATSPCKKTRWMLGSLDLTGLLSLALKLDAQVQLKALGHLAHGFLAGQAAAGALGASGP